MILKFAIKGKSEIKVDLSSKNIRVTEDLGQKVKEILSKAKDLKEIK